MLAVRFFLVVFLVLLQGLAPLVHAHAGKGLPAGDGKLHVPGLEAYTQDGGVVLGCAGLDTIMSDTLAIGVHSGIEPNHEAVATGQNLFCWLTNAAANARPALCRSYRRYRPPQPLTPTAPSLLSHSPRAPPLA